MSKATDKKEVLEMLGIVPEKGEVFTLATVEELSNNKGDEEDE